MICSVFVGVSVDGFMARTDGRFDFLPADGGEEHGYSAFIASVDAIVMGRGTFDVVLGFDHWPFRQPVIVLTSRACDAELPANAVLEFMSAEPIEVVARLAARGMQHLYVDGGITIQRFLNAGLIDRATITRVPVLIGSGISLFGPTDRDIRLRHVETRTYSSGLVTSEYDVLRT
jgi:dihydrofolate reductase